MSFIFQIVLMPPYHFMKYFGLYEGSAWKMPWRDTLGFWLWGPFIYFPRVRWTDSGEVTGSLKKWKDYFYIAHCLHLKSWWTEEGKTTRRKLLSMSSPLSCAVLLSLSVSQVGLDQQTFLLVCTNRRRQFLLDTADSSLTVWVPPLICSPSFSLASSPQSKMASSPHLLSSICANSKGLDCGKQLPSWHALAYVSISVRMKEKRSRISYSLSLPLSSNPPSSFFFLSLSSPDVFWQPWRRPW